MPTTSFTTRIDIELKSKLEKIAKYEDRSASYMANQAIRALVEEREASSELIETSLELLDKMEQYSSEDVSDWLGSPAGTPFPTPIKS
jgi:predicted transcriptional regulator